MNEANNRQRTLLAVALGVPTMAQVLAELPRLAKQADIVELRLDYLTEPYDLVRLLADRAVPLVVTNRPVREGGRSVDDDATRIDVLRRAAKLGAEYVDLEWDAATSDAVAALKAAGARVIVSRHSFMTMPPELADWASYAIACGADVVKVVGMARDPLDALLVYQVLKTADRPTIAIAMGEYGIPSRILAPRFDACLLTFCAPSSADGTAPGQISVSDMRAVYRANSLCSSTEIFGLLSPRVERDLAEKFNRGFADLGVNATAVPIPSNLPIRQVIDGYRALPVHGWWVSDSADQRDALSAVDEVRPAAARAAALNWIRCHDGRLVGDWLDDPVTGGEAWTTFD